MLIVISPAKTLDFDNARIVKHDSFPEHAHRANELVSILKKYDLSELMQLMGISDKLASLNFYRFKQWQAIPAKDLARQAICAFKGEVYTGLNVDDWDDIDFDFAQDHLRILSGLYGVLRPLDYIAPYRLEMGTKLQTKESENLYEFWGDTLTKSIKKTLSSQGDNILINLASNEYFKSLKAKDLNSEIITPVFKDFKKGQYKLISIYAKKARGMMSRYIIKNQISDVHKLKEFTEEGYLYNDRLTKGNEWVFTRD